ncbi:VOC family protein [Halobacillus sp. H74]|uniref:VOC family protein n=1 Tax=Halobacillus sp. H74 TaxID=3457436 RepID=UPI003FCC7FF4
MEIRKVILKTKDIKSMKHFYTDTLEMPLTKDTEESFQVAAGSSLLEFTSSNVEGDPFYHFAFDIPSNKFREAKAWVEAKVELNDEDGEDEADFPHIPAHSLYFYDPAGNIVEFISRHSSADKSEEAFSHRSILRISEMSLTVEDAINTGQKLINLGLKERDNAPISDSSLNFMGKSATSSFLLLIQPGRRWIFSDKISAIFPVEITLDTNDRIVVKDNNETVANPTC